MIVSATGLGVSFGGDDIFSGLNFNINRGDRTALVGVNGAGKTTLLRVLAGELEPSHGSVHFGGNARIAYLPQQMNSFLEGPLLQAVCAGAGDASEALRRMDYLHGKMETSDTQEIKEIFSELEKTHDIIDSSDAFNIKTKAEIILTGLGFTVAEFTKPLEEFSGGWRMRAQLASLLVADPELLLMDEPTNHLDLEARIWLEEYLRKFNGAVWIISHDPGFLDRIVTVVREIEFGEMLTWSGNFTFYEKKKSEDIHLRDKQAKHQAQQIEKTKRFIKRFKATESKRFQVRSREKMLEKMEIVKTHRNPAHIKLRFPEPPRSGEIVAVLENVSKEYDKVIFSAVNMTICKGERLGIVGKNGEGKSTLSKILAEAESPTSGTLKIGSGVVNGFYSQDSDRQIKEGMNILEYLSATAASKSEKELRNVLGRFLFTGDDVFKKVSVLSGGERSRLEMAALLLQPINFLILDEPTNHLDIISRRVLIEALEEYTGTLVVVSHDEQLLSALAEKVIEVSSGTVRPFLGGFSSYLEKKQEEVRRRLNQGKVSVSKISRKEMNKAKKHREAAIRKKEYARKTKLNKRLRRIEEKLTPLENRKDELERLLSTPSILEDGQKVMVLQQEHSYTSQKIKEYQNLWEKIVEDAEV